MKGTERPVGNPMAKWFSKPFRWLSTGIGFFFRAAVILWATLALFYSNLPWAPIRLILAIAFLIFGVWALWLTRRPRMRLVFAVLFLGVLGWFLSIRPSHDRPWRVDRYLYRARLVGTSLPFAELRRCSRIDEVAKAAGDAPDFSRRIRASLPVP